MKTITLDKEFFEICGTLSIEGALGNAGIYKPQPITILFPQTSSAWRQKNGGPDLYLVPEFVPYCLMDSVLRLTRMGYTITLEYVTESEIAK